MSNRRCEACGRTEHPTAVRDRLTICDECEDHGARPAHHYHGGNYLEVDPPTMYTRPDLIARDRPDAVLYEPQGRYKRPDGTPVPRRN